MDLEIHLPHRADANLVQQCVHFLSPHVSAASVRPLGRYGYTNSRLYLVYCAPANGGIPFVIKTDRQKVMQREAEGVGKLAVYFTGAYNARVFPSPDAPQAIIYPLVTLDGHETVQELREVVYQPVGSRPDQPSSADLLSRTYDSCRQAHVLRDATFKLGDQYAWYLRETPERLLTDPLPALFARGGRVQVYGHELNDPRRILHRVKDKECDSKVGPVHGDLHPNNVLFGPDFSPVLIDYAFGHLDGHFVKDFVLMECSLRFLLAPRLLQPDAAVQFDEHLLREDGYRSAADTPSRGRTEDVIHEMASLVGTIRSQCRSRFEDYDFREFLLAQYLVLMGNIRLLPYQDFRTLLALCRIADHIDEEGIA